MMKSIMLLWLATKMPWRAPAPALPLPASGAVGRMPWKRTTPCQLATKAEASICTSATSAACVRPRPQGVSAASFTSGKVSAKTTKPSSRHSVRSGSSTQ